MDKSIKYNRNFRMKCAAPCPYSQSWSGMGHQRKSYLLDKNSSKTSSRITNVTKKTYSSSMTTDTQTLEASQQFMGLEPSQSHLKYGLFPKKSCLSSRQSRILTVKPSVRIACDAESDDSRKRSQCIIDPWRLELERPAIARASTVQTFLRDPTKVYDEPSIGPVFVFRPLERRDLRHLTLSASTHLDIKPRTQRGILTSQLCTTYL